MVVVILSGFALIASQQLLSVVAVLRLGAAERRASALEYDRRLCERLTAEALYTAEEGLGDVRGELADGFLLFHSRLLNAAVAAPRYEVGTAEAGGPLVGWASLRGTSSPLRTLAAVGLPVGGELGHVLRRGTLACAEPGRSRFTIRPPGAPAPVGVEVHSRALGVPLTQFPQFFYLRPNELGASGSQSWAGDVTFAGLASSARAGGVSSLGINLRHQVAYGSTAYGRLFSNEELERLLAACGATHVLDLRRDPSDAPTGNPRLSGVGHTAVGAAEVDLSLLGFGSRRTASGLLIERRVMIVLIAGSGAVIRLRDTSATGVTAYPFGIVVIGEPGAAQPVRVEIDQHLVRESVLVLRSCVLAVSRPVGRLPLALYLSPDCSLAASDPFQVAHLSCHASLAESVRRHGLEATGELSPALEESCPRALLVWSRAVTDRSGFVGALVQQ